MSQARSGRSDGGAARRNPAALKAADGLAFAASPTFALMALLTSVLGGSLAQTPHLVAHASPLSGMAAMYLLMSFFHLSPWLKLACRGP